MAGKPAPLRSFDHTRLKPGETALFLDFDGTLADLAEQPDAVSVPLPTREDLARLERSTGGALAIVTGRPIEEIDRFLAPLNLPVAGVHGLERRAAGGKRSSAVIDEELFVDIRDKLKVFSNANPGTVIETKMGSLALHYRQRPDLAEAGEEAVREAVNGHAGVAVLHGKMVIEVKSGQATKGDAINAFMKEPPFRGRIPIFAGDDVTDEDAFREIVRINGISIKIGGGKTAASYRTDDPGTFRDWLRDLANSFDGHRLTA